MKGTKTDFKTSHLLLAIFQGIVFRAVPVLVLAVLGLFLIPIGLMYRSTSTDTKFPKQYEGWKLVKMPKYFWIWDNDEVGAMGDHTWPGSLAKSFLSTKLKLSVDHPVAMWWWLAVRNPVNNLQQLVGQRMEPSAVISYSGDSLVDDRAGKAGNGWHLVKCKSGGKTTYSFYLVKYYSDNYCLRIRIGYKVKPEMNIALHQSRDDLVGSVFVINPFKRLV